MKSSGFPEEVTLKKAASKQEKLKYLINMVKMSSDKLHFYIIIMFIMLQSIPMKL